jgi:catechol 2,3-dioxygenase-like lactoylglutathione lyase family enzyme
MVLFASLIRVIRVIRGAIMPRMKLLLAVMMFVSSPAFAQLSEPNAAGVAMGHLHYHVRDVEANKRFWVTLGGRSLRIGNVEAVKLPGVLVFLTQGESSGGTEGSSVNHVAFRVPSLAAVEAAGLRVTPVAGFPGVASTATPEGERVELFEDAARNLTFTQDAGFNDAAAQRHNRPVGVPVAFHHIHMYVVEPDIAKVKDWYVRLFGGVPGKRSQYDAVDLPGMNLNISAPPRGSAPTRGRMLDHIGLEIKGLEAFCAKLVAMGVKLDTPYSKGTTGFATATLTDPWGTTIELTEGLRGY